MAPSTVCFIPNLLQPPPHDLEATTEDGIKTKLRQHAEANGYKLTIRSSEYKHLRNSLRFQCHRSGPKPSDNSSSQKTNCPFSLKAYEVVAPNVPEHLQALVQPTQVLPAAGTWKIEVKNGTHNHGPIGSETRDPKYQGKSLSAIKQRSNLISNKLSQLSSLDRAKALAEIQQVLVKYQSFNFAPQPSHLSPFDLAISQPIPPTSQSKSPTHVLIPPPLEPLSVTPIPEDNLVKKKKKRKKVKRQPEDLPAPDPTNPEQQPSPTRDPPLHSALASPAPLQITCTNPLLALPLTISPNAFHNSGQTIIPPLKDSRLASQTQPNLIIDLQGLVDYESDMPSRSPTIKPDTPASPALLESLVGALADPSPATSVLAPLDVADLPHISSLSIPFADQEEDESFDFEALLPPLNSLTKEIEGPTAAVEGTSALDDARANITVTSPRSHSPQPCGNRKRTRRMIEPKKHAQFNQVRRSARHNKTDSGNATRRSTRQMTQSSKIKVFHDPIPDGHCGYRAIANSLGRSEDEWLSVRNDLIFELQSKTDFYNRHLEERKRGDGDVSDVIKSIQTQREEVLDTPALWLNSAQMLYIIATAYKRPFCVYGEDLSFSALPLDCSLTNNPPIFLFFDKKRVHFLSLTITTPPPIPDPWREWHNLALPVAQEWFHNYLPQFKLFKDCILPILAVEKPLFYGDCGPVELCVISDSE
ncbi:hypothetical protein DFH28DRAFT_1133117 [Melampsora americana]|nr:hypothetical protein DFH28DRAFT_1133117 [Melampsora americana]